MQLTISQSRRNNCRPTATTLWEGTIAPLVFSYFILHGRNMETKGTLDEKARIGCDCEDCENRCSHAQTTILSPACHPGQGVLAVYQAGTGVLILKCTICHELCTSVKVADN